MAQVVWVSQTTSRIWIAFATHAKTKSGRAPSFTLSLHKTLPSRSEIAAVGGVFRTEVNDGASGLGFPDHFPYLDRICDTCEDEVGTGAILHAFPSQDSSFPVRNRGGGGRISDRSERWRKWSGFPRPLPVVGSHLRHMRRRSRDGRHPSRFPFTRLFLPGPKSRRWGADFDRSERWRKWSGFPRPLPVVGSHLRHMRR